MQICESDIDFRVRVDIRAVGKCYIHGNGFIVHGCFGELPVESLVLLCTDFIYMQYWVHPLIKTEDMYDGPKSKWYLFICNSHLHPWLV